MTLTGDVERLMVYVGQSDHAVRADRHSKVAVYVEIVERARKAGMAGATVLQGTAGFGASSRVHRQQPVPMADAAPVVVVIVDFAERIETFLRTLDEMALDALVVRQRVEVLVHHVRGNRRRR